jgi:hypothetical protein
MPILKRILKMVLGGVPGRSHLSTSECTGGKNTYPLAYERSERCKRSLVCTSSTCELPAALSVNGASRRAGRMGEMKTHIEPPQVPRRLYV